MKKKPKVLFLNINFSLDQSLGFATIICNETRALLEVDEYRKLNHPLIMPLGNLSKILKDKLKGLDILDYGLSLKKIILRHLVIIVFRLSSSDRICTLSISYR